MRFSSMLAPTLREVPSEADIPSHRLMLRAALIRPAAGGVYTFLPLGFRVLQKIMGIVREEMNKTGSQELLLPILQPADLWHQTGRWSDYGDEMFRLEDRHGRLFCLGPTHEEIITDLVRREIRSYKQLPVTLYQMQNKYRDEIRPRFGVLRGREFIMKDAYSFDVDQEGLDKSYATMYDAYNKIFSRCGLKARAVEAFAGAIGGEYNHEFVVPAETGEDEIATCTLCDYAANVELAQVIADEQSGGDQVGIANQLMSKVETPGIKTINDLADFLNVDASDIIKTLVYNVDERPVAVLIRGDRELNEAKLAQTMQATRIEPADPENIHDLTGSPFGYLGPVGLKGIPIIADHEITRMEIAITGANESDLHLTNVVYGRDYTVDQQADLRMVTPDDPCPKCGGPMEIRAGIELGHIFQLGTKYSESIGATYLDNQGVERPIIMGCYGIGVSRMMAAIIESNHDEHGIVWPMTVTPYHVTIIVINPKNEQLMAVAENLYDELWASGVEVMIDDRDERPGIKFNDADLIGFPLRVTIGPRSLASNSIEIRDRKDGKDAVVHIGEAVQYIRQRIELGKDEYVQREATGKT